MLAFPARGSGSKPRRVYGVVILIVILVCLIVLAYQGSDMITAMSAIVAIATAAVQLTRRLLQTPPSPGTQT